MLKNAGDILDNPIMSDRLEYSPRSSRAEIIIAMMLFIPIGVSFSSEATEAKDTSAEIEKLVMDASRQEKKGDCESAYRTYYEAEGLVSGIKDKTRSSDYESIISGKMDRLRACYKECQPTERERAVFISAKDLAASQPRRAAQMLKKILIAKNEKCSFWSGARSLLLSIPPQEGVVEKDDPCDASPEIKKSLNEAEASAKRQIQQVSQVGKSKIDLTSRLPELISLFREIDGTRMQVFRLREEYLNCEEIYNRLSLDSTALNDAIFKIQGTIVTAYNSQISMLSGKIQSFQKKLRESEGKISTQVKEMEILKKQFAEMSSFNEEIFNDLFNLIGIESVKFTASVEGRKIEQTIPDIQSILADEAKVLKTMQNRYPEYFKDGVNVEGLKRRKFVMEKLHQMLEKFGKRYGTAVGYDSTLSELDANIKLLDKSIKIGEEYSAGGGKIPTLYIALALALACIASITAALLIGRKRRNR